MNTRIFSIRVLMMMIGVSSLAWGQVGGDFEITGSVISSGGGKSTGGDFELTGAIGQPTAGALAGGDFELSGGFLFPIEPGDCDQDGDVDLADFLSFQECFSAAGTPSTVGCQCSDLDGDADVDLADYVAFQAVFTGAF